MEYKGNPVKGWTIIFKKNRTIRFDILNGKRKKWYKNIENEEENKKRTPPPQKNQTKTNKTKIMR